MKLIDAIEYVRLARYEMTLAIISAEDFKESPYYRHIVWHNFLPWFGDGNPTQLAHEIETILVPAMMPDRLWVQLVPGVQAYARYLKLVDATRYPQCGRCS